MRRATSVFLHGARSVLISIHALHEESDPTQSQHERHPTLISIHALHEESDSKAPMVSDPLPISIHALHEESDGHIGAARTIPVISIHALHEESDVPRVPGTVCGRVISIHALHEESDPATFVTAKGRIFQSTLSMRRATPCPRRPCASSEYFNPRSP